jgi:NAD(P)-dependent dehydrogenase (short-subunit alcohol dehydrogenase family)
MTIGADLKGKTVIVTGAAGNLGSACAREIAGQGAAVLAADIPKAGLQRIADDINSFGGQVVAHEGDISAEADVKAMVDAALRAFGRIDALVNVAAAMRYAAGDRDLETMTVEDWDKVMAVNLRGTMLCCKHAIPSMVSQGGGAVVNFGSTAAIRGDAGLIAYSTTKAGLLGFTRAVATTYGKRGIRCNAVCPGSVWSAETKARMGSERLDLIERTRITPRLGVPEDVAHMVVFLISDKATYITGETFMVDGGGTAHQPWFNVK